MQLLIRDGHVECPACGLLYEKVKEQDKRVHVMHHPIAPLCSLTNRSVRVDRLTGYGEIYGEA